MIEKHNLIPSGSLLGENGKPYDYVDSFRGLLNIQCPDIDELGRLFMSSGPAWADGLMKIRDRIVGIFGLKSGARMLQEQRELEPSHFLPGERAGLFKVFQKTENELIMGEDDKHLDFRVSILIPSSAFEQGKTTFWLTTVVIYKNWFGRLYFFPVQFFHRLIVKFTLKSMLQRINGQYAD